MLPAVDYERIFQSSPNGYMLLDRELRYVTANATYLRLTGSKLEELVGRRIFDVFPHDPNDPKNENARMLRESFERVRDTKKQDFIAVIHYRVAREHGGPLEDRYWSATHTPLLDDRGELAFILQHTVDITELHRLRTAAQGQHTSAIEAGVLGRAHMVQQENRSLDEQLRDLRRLYDQAPGFVAYLRGPQHVFVLANEAYNAVVGRGNLVGKSVREALPEIEGQGFLELLDRVYRTGEPYIGRGEVVELRRDGVREQVFVDFVYQPILDADGNVGGIFVQGSDITEQKRLEAERSALLAREQAARAEAENANRLKDDFLATVSHELRTPLSAMLGWVQMMRKGSLPDERRQHGLEVIERNARAQAQLIDDILDLSRIVSGKMKLDVEPIDIGHVVDAAIESIRPAADAKGIELMQVVADGSHVIGDAVRLQQMVWNLLSNAVKFTPRGGHVRAEVRHSASAVEITVRDDGQGIDPEFVPFVFDRFRQAEASIRRKHGGLGLGLSIVKELTELHGGTIAVSSDGPGQGATFRIRLPMSPLRRDTDAQRKRTPSSPDVTCPEKIANLRVLVVDDEPDARELLREMLERCGARVTLAGSVEEAMEAMRKAPPDVLLSDIGMPNEDGYSLIRKVRALPADRGGRVPAVALTAYARTEDRTRALLAGYRAHVPKPVDFGELLAVIAAVAA